MEALTTGTKALVDATEKFFDSVAGELNSYEPKNDKDFKKAIQLAQLCAECMKIVKLKKDESEKKSKKEKPLSLTDQWANKDRDASHKN